MKGRKREVYQALVNAKGDSEGYTIEKKKIDPKHNYYSYRLVTDG